MSLAVDAGSLPGQWYFPGIAGKGQWIELPAEAYQPIEQGSVTYGQEKYPEESRQFLILFSRKSETGLFEK